MTVTARRLGDEKVDSAVNVRRFANDSIRDVGRRFGGDSSVVLEFLCECGDLRCGRFVKLTLAEYEASPPGSVRDH